MLFSRESPMIRGLRTVLTLDKLGRAEAWSAANFYYILAWLHIAAAQGLAFANLTGWLWLELPAVCALSVYGLLATFALCVWMWSEVVGLRAGPDWWVFGAITAIFAGGFTTSVGLSSTHSSITIVGWLVWLAGAVLLLSAEHSRQHYNSPPSRKKVKA